MALDMILVSTGDLKEGQTFYIERRSRTPAKYSENYPREADLWNAGTTVTTNFYPCAVLKGYEVEDPHQKRTLFRFLVDTPDSIHKDGGHQVPAGSTMPLENIEKEVYIGVEK